MHAHSAPHDLSHRCNCTPPRHFTDAESDDKTVEYKGMQKLISRWWIRNKDARSLSLSLSHLVSQEVEWWCSRTQNYFHHVSCFVHRCQIQECTVFVFLAILRPLQPRRIRHHPLRGDKWEKLKMAQEVQGVVPTRQWLQVIVTATIIAPISCDTRQNTPLDSTRLRAGMQDDKYEAAAAIHMYTVYSLILRERERESKQMAASLLLGLPMWSQERGGLEVVLGEGGETPWSLAPWFQCGRPTPRTRLFVAGQNPTWWSCSMWLVTW